MKALKEKVEYKLFKQDQSLQIVHMLCKPKPYYDEQRKVAIGYKIPLCLARAKQVQPAHYNGHEIIKSQALYFQITQLTKKISVLQEQNKLFRVENAKVKQHYKELYDSIKITRAKHIDQTTALLTKNENLKVQINAKLKCVTIDSIIPKVLAPGMYAIDVEPIPPHCRNNREVHLEYLKHLKESVATIHEIVEEAGVERPLDSSLAFAYLYTKRSQELVEYMVGTCTKDFNKRDKKQATTPLTKKKQVTFVDQCKTSNNNTHKHVEQQTTQKTYVPMILSTRVNSCTHASGSKPRSNTKKNWISPATRVIKKTIEDHPRTNKFRNDHFGAIMGYRDYVIGESVIFKVVQIVHCYLDSSCSKHMTWDRPRLMNFVKKFIETVRFRNDHFGAIMGYRDYVIGESVIFKVYYVKGLGYNLFSVGQFSDSDLEVAFRKHLCYVQDTDGIFHQKSVPRTSQQNGVVERRNRTFVEAALTMLIFSKALMFLWAEAVATAFPAAVAAPRAVDPAGSPSLTLIDQDAKTSLPPPPQQSTTDPILVKSIGEQTVDDIVTDVVDWAMQVLALEERLDKHGSRLFKLENLNIPHQPPPPPPLAGASSTPDGVSGTQELSPTDSLIQDDSIPDEQYCRQVNKTELTQVDLEGQAYEVVKAFYPDVIHLHFQMKECHKMLTDHVDWTNPEGDQVRVDQVEDFQLGIESYQTQLDLIKPGWDGTGYEFKYDYTIIESLRAVVFLVNNNERKIMRFNEIYKFSDSSLTRILEALAYRVKHDSSSRQKEVTSHMRILSVVRIKAYSRYGYDYLSEIVLWKADLQEHTIAKKDFKNLYPSDFKDLNLLLLQGHLDHLPGSDKQMLSTATQLDLIKPGWDATGYEFKYDYTIIESPRAVVFLVNNNERKIMRFNEIYKFSDSTLTRILEALAYKVKEFKIKRLNPGMNTRFLTQNDMLGIKSLDLVLPRLSVSTAYVITASINQLVLLEES
nr:integrase, catalytic region, zinc finger, CCHC-type, peptidase aspartic, catalytic [Tanacetum cinerariifolium]